MTRTYETIDRGAWNVMLAAVPDGDVQAALAEQLDEWAGGNCCRHIEVMLDSTGRLDSQSSPRPAD